MPRKTIPQIDAQIASAKRKLAYERRRDTKLAQLATLRAEIASMRERERGHNFDDACPCEACMG